MRCMVVFSAERSCCPLQEMTGACCNTSSLVAMCKAVSQAVFAWSPPWTRHNTVPYSVPCESCYAGRPTASMVHSLHGHIHSSQSPTHAHTSSTRKPCRLFVAEHCMSAASEDGKGGLNSRPLGPNGHNLSPSCFTISIAPNVFAGVPCPPTVLGKAIVQYAGPSQQESVRV